MLNISRLSLIACLGLFAIGSAWAGGAKSPEALAMALVNALRSGDVAVVVALHHFVPTQTASVAEQQALARREWRALIGRFKVSGYRLSMLPAEERQRFSDAGYSGLKPIKKLVINLVARQGTEKRSTNHYVVSVAGSYFFINQKSS